MECEFPTQNSTTDEIKELLTTNKNIAIVGLSPNPQKDSHQVGKYLQEAGYKIFPIYPKEDVILGEKVYRSLEDIDEKIDIVDVFRKPAVVPQILQQMQKKDGIKALWLQIGIVNNEAAEQARQLGYVVVQNKCTKIEHQKMVNGNN
jgi:predicted CoA-binding protein